MRFYQTLDLGRSVMQAINLGNEMHRTRLQMQHFTDTLRLHHRFFAGQLGDGRAVSLFETVNSKGESWEIQLKGAGRTPYSRFGDGYAVLRSSIREFLMSEHMHALGVPTTRALALIETTRDVYRDDGPKGSK